jgi:hypothetical protein
MDYGQWVERLRGFVLRQKEASSSECQANIFIEIRPPLNNNELSELAGALDCGLPEPLHEFLRTGASSIAFQFACPESGETSDVFCPADKLPEWREECVDYARESWLMEPDWPLDQAFWRHALPLVHYPDGDGVALWVHDRTHPNPPVIYLKHEDESFLLSRTFDEFLTHWERLSYIGTNVLKSYRDPATGFLELPRSKQQG